MQSQVQDLTSHCRSIFLAGVAALLIASAAIPTAAQTSVPPTAAQAARMPQFAAKLVQGASRIPHPAQPRASYKNPADAFTRTKHSWLPPGNSDLYDNGPTNGTANAWTINFGFVVSNSFPVGSGNLTAMTFAAWVYPGDVLQSAEVQIGTTPFGNDVFDQVVGFTQSDCASNQYGFNVCNETGNFNPSVGLNGNYWVTLQNAAVNTGDPVYWDENSGPSSAESNMVGTIPSESFTMLGSGGGGPVCFSPGRNLQALYNFTDQQAVPNGVALDQAGNLYGTGPSSGSHGAGFAFKLARFADWLFDPLFSFFGGTNGGQPSGAIIGLNGSLYGGAQGGIQNCGSDGSQYCGLVYNLTPPPTACATALCGWTENVPYRFSSESDGSGVIYVSAHDQQGNLYGTTTTGGAHGAGTVFELTRSGLSWTKTTLYSFTGGRDGTTPTQVLVGNDGNLYGVAGGGVFRGGVVFQLTPSGGQWTETVVHPFGFEGDFDPASLVKDGAGNLYGIAQNSFYLTDHGAIFVLQKAGSTWVFSEYLVNHNEFDFLNNLAIDAAGKVYGTGSDFSTFLGTGRDKGPGGGIASYDSYIFRAWYDGTWHYEDLRYLGNQYFDSSGSLGLDASGNLYGTTRDCGTNNSGTVWQLSP